MTTTTETKTFLDGESLKRLAAQPPADPRHVEEVVAKALSLDGLETEEAAVLLGADSPESITLIRDAARRVKEEIYGRRIVLFAPLYTDNHCDNNCLYCGFRRDNREMERVTLTRERIREETKAILASGHKRILFICGESASAGLDDILTGIETAYATRLGNASLRRINVEIAPLSVSGFRRLKEAGIGTYVCFQETYDPELYRRFHPSGPKADYRNRLYVMHRAMEGGINDVGLGALFGLGDYRYETLALLEHARELERSFGCGPHTVSVPRLEPAAGAPLSTRPPAPVSDDAFRTIVAVIRLSLPYTGIILSTREPPALRNELFRFGVSQISAGSVTTPGGYAAGQRFTGAQFALGDTRSLEEVVSDLVEAGLVPSFCTACYRRGRVGKDFMDLAKPGLIKEYCLPNGLLSFAEYLRDYASPAVRARGTALVLSLVDEEVRAPLRETMRRSLAAIARGESDLYR